MRSSASESPAGKGAPTAVTNDYSSRYAVREYVVKGGSLPLSTNLLASLFSPYTGTNLGLVDIVKAAADLQSTYREAAGQNVTVSIAKDRITNGIVTLNIFRGRFAHILVSGRSYFNPDDKTDLAAQVWAAQSGGPRNGGANPAAATARTNSDPRLVVKAYEITGDTLLSMDTLTSIFAKKTGTNIAVADVIKAGSDLQMEYRNRGYPTVNVTIPPQQITNGIVKIRVFEGRLSDMIVTNNHYFSSNNVMRNLPSLVTNTILLGPVFQAELDRANANQDRQIYPQIAPGPDENTSVLLLDVKDRLPLHAKVELNNQSSPGTPDLRINTSAAYNNLWQYENSLGVQYSFSPEEFKNGNQWNIYDQPLVANYSAFYRVPLGNPESLSAALASNSAGFGYNEATRKFDLPPPSGRPELSFYASRSTIDTGVQLSPEQVLVNVPFVRQISRQDSQQDLTINQAAGLRLNEPLREVNDWRTSLSLGADYKNYVSDSLKNNTVVTKEITVNTNNQPNPPTISTIVSPVSTNGPIHKPLEYLPLSARVEAGRRYNWGASGFGLGLSVNAWHSGSSSNLFNISGSPKSSDHWLAITPGISQDIFIRTNWDLSLRADGQWASSPLISNEQFGAGGVNSVRGYHEGEVFGDTGWHVSIEQKTPPHVVGLAYGRQLLTFRGSLYMDYAETYLLDPRGRESRVPLWGTGFGAVAAIGSYWEARLLFSWPLLNMINTRAGEPYFNFALTAQF